MKKYVFLYPKISKFRNVIKKIILSQKRPKNIVYTL